MTRGLACVGRVLLLPATRRDGEAVCALLERRNIDCLVCSTAAQVVHEIEQGADVLVFTDSALTTAGGLQIVTALEAQPSWSDLPVVLLGKVSALPEVEAVIGRMTNVTVLERPSSIRSLVSAIHTSLRARARQYVMRDQVEALKKAEHALRQTDRRKDEFLAMLAHELRNPLAPIRTASDLLPRIVPPGNARVDSTLKVVKRQVGQLSRLVDDLLDVSRITQGRVELQREVLDLTTVVGQALESVDPQMKEKRHTVMRQAHWPALHVFGDRARLVQCVSNILANAAKYTDMDGLIQLQFARQGDRAVLSVQDNGVGMSQDLLPKIFDLFVQSERSLDRAEGGLGIGLSVVRQLIEMHEGSVTAHSPGPGMGSIFEISIPLVDAPAVAGAAAQTTDVARRKVLIVDDNQDAADSLCMLIESSGHEVRTAYRGAAALELVQGFSPDVILLDIGLPEMNGYEVVRRLRATGVTAQVVALTGYGQPEDVRRAKESGFDGHMVKPVDLDRLMDVLAH